MGPVVSDPGDHNSTSNHAGGVKEEANYDGPPSLYTESEDQVDVTNLPTIILTPPTNELDNVGPIITELFAPNFTSDDGPNVTKEATLDGPTRRPKKNFAQQYINALSSSTELEDLGSYINLMNRFNVVFQLLF